MAIAIDKTLSMVQFANQSSASNISFSSLPVVGSVVIVEIVLYGNQDADIASVTDNQGHGSYNLVKGSLAASNFVRSVIAWVPVATSSGTFTLTINWGAAGGCYANVGANSWTGLAASPGDRSGANGATNTSTDASVVATSANSQADELVIAVMTAIHDSANLHITTATTGYTNLFNYQNYDYIAGSADYKIVSASETSQANWSHDATNGGYFDGWSSVIATFKAAVGGVSTYTFVASGGLTITGSVMWSKVRAVSAVGGLAFAGTSAILRKAIRLAAGGLSFAGTGTALRRLVQACAGGLMFGGSAPYSSSALQTLTLTAAGGITFAGAALIRAVRVVAGAAGVALSGTGAVLRKLVQACAGGITFGGAASTVFHEVRRTVAAAGGLVFSGAAGVTTYLAVAASSAAAWIHRIRRRRR